MTTFTSLAARKGGPIALVAILAAGFAATGCGSSKKSSTATIPALTKAQFIARGNAICTEGNQKQRTLQKAAEKLFGKHEPSAAQIGAYVNGTFAPLIQVQIDRIKALPAPAGEQATVSSMLGLAQSDLEKVKSNPRLLFAETHPFRDFAQTAHAYGLTECAKNA
jgi:hypothetical protein